MSIYPTKEEIMAEEQKFKPEVLKIVRSWKRVVWDKDQAVDGRYIQLKVLAQALGVVYNNPVQVKYCPEDYTCHYNIKEKTISINSSASIISLLHEFAHHLFGSSELKACRWSVWLFKKTFPKAFQKLEWKGHMLKKI
jgi:hypothetical protein